MIKIFNSRFFPSNNIFNLGKIRQRYNLKSSSKVMRNEKLAPLFFVHIPKTAGTSFRIAAQHFFGDKSLCHDYGPDSPDTSSLVHLHIYNNNDFFGLQNNLLKSSCQFFGGHFKVSRYASLFPATHIISFVREPSEQLYSHYAHYVRLNGYNEDFEAFLSTQYGRPGLHSRMLSGIPLEAIGFIGVTERYEESLRIFNACYGTNFQAKLLNQNPEKGSPCTFFPKIIAKFDRQLSADRRLYARANVLLDTRLHALENDQPFVHGAVRGLTAAHVSGFAFYQHISDPVRLEILVNNSPVHITTALNLRPGLRALNVPRNGYVGFDYKPQQHFFIGDRITVRVFKTEQILGDAVVQKLESDS